MSAAVPADRASAIYRDGIVFDALNICNFSRDIFQEWRDAGVSGVSVTCAVWENFRDTIQNIVQWGRWFDENADLIVQARSVADIRAAKAAGRTAVVLSWQNTSSLEDQLGYIRIFRDLGVRIMQLTYNTQNYSGAGYIEARDSGLTGFGREVVDEMGRLGVVCDLSHVGIQTTRDVIAYAKVPPAFTHILPHGMKAHPRNKLDEDVRALADAGGAVGVSLFAPSMARGNDSTIDDYIAAVDYLVNLAGEDAVGLGTDWSQGHPRPGTFLQWCNLDKGYARVLTPFGSSEVKKPAGIARIAEMPNLPQAMSRAGWSESRMEKFLGENWLRYLERVWGA